MTIDLSWLQGKVVEDPLFEDLDINFLLAGFLKSLVQEQQSHEQQEVPS